MPVLANPRYERFAQEIFNGKLSQVEAFAAAGFKPNESHACRLAARSEVKARVAELLAASAEKAEITQAMVLAELAKIGFSDIRKAVRWYSQANIAAVDDSATGEIEDGTIRVAVANQVELISSDDIDDETAAAISEVSMTDKGGLKVKFHDKRAALVDIAKMNGWFKERVEHTGKDGGPIEIADSDLARLTVFLLSKEAKKV